MDTTKTIETALSTPGTDQVSSRNSRPASQEKKTECKDGICQVTWKPVKRLS